MNWLQRLSETYENCSQAIGKIEKKKIKNKEVALTPLLPICHTMQNAHIEVTLDEAGTFLSAKVVDKDDAPTLIPCTESSSGRTNGQCPHPLHDKLEYVARDFYERTGGSCDFESYKTQLNQWITFSENPESLKAVLQYLDTGSLIQDCARVHVLHLDENNQLINSWETDDNPPPIFKLLPGGFDNKGKQKPWQGNVFCRFCVEIKSSLSSSLQADARLWKSWSDFYAVQESKSGLCLISARTVTIAQQHPSKIRNAGDKAKLISANDGSGFTFRGKFLESDEACGVSFDITQKAHNALRWLLARQGRRFGDLNIVTWATIGELPPDPFKSSFDLFIVPSSVADEESDGGLLEDKPLKKKAKKSKTPIVIHTAKQFSDKLNSMLSGYAGKFSNDDASQVVIMAIDSATPGRMAIRYYRELKGSEFLDRVREWHESCAWYQYFGVNKQFVGAPAPRDIAQAAYGKKLDTKDKLLGATVSRLLPCIMDAAPIPRDLVESCVRRASQRISTEFWEWSKSLGIACSLFRHRYQERKYTMEYETERNTRDYLYGSLLAIAEHIEERALHLAKEKRDTHAAKLMQRFAERPFSTWRTIELQLTPSISRLRNNRPTVHQRLKSLLDETYSRFEKGEDVQDHPLSGEFLIGYHTLRKKLWEDAKKTKDPDIVEIEESLNEVTES